ncbi:MAG: 1,4-dihydroxy-6-naphthoate synthase [Flavobacteriales bacterium]|nr:1,4-dihydroxy-6-naphthoate synthase [Flavobacteriales bacterium]
MKKMKIGFSPCPNDTFIFDALIHDKIDTEGLKFEVIMADVEELNQRAFRGDLAITKLSYHAFFHVLKTYVMMDSGSALGRNCGPLLIKNQGDSNPLSEDLIAIPGKYTTANFLLNFAFPSLQHKKEMLFSDIESAVRENEVKAGLIIHENRFTYSDRGFEKVSDLGAYWEQETNTPIPLGGIAIDRSLDRDIQHKVQRLIRKSISYAFENPMDSSAFVRANAQEMNEDVMRKHIDLYVNDYSLSLGEKGKEAVEKMYDFMLAKGHVKSSENLLFI